MDLISLQEFFGWCSVINFGILMFVTLIMVFFQKSLVSIHSSLLKINKEELPKLYIYYLAFYKICVFIFCLGPCMALKILS